MKRTQLAIAAALALSGPAQGQDVAFPSFITGEDLHQLCQRTPAVAQAYVLGIIDAHLTAQTLAQDARKRGSPIGLFEGLSEDICLPINTGGQTLSDVVCKLLADQPGYRQYAGQAIVWAAITETYGTDCRPE